MQVVFVSFCLWFLAAFMLPVDRFTNLVTRLEVKGLFRIAVWNIGCSRVSLIRLERFIGYLWLSVFKVKFRQQGSGHVTFWLYRNRFEFVKLRWTTLTCVVQMLRSLHSWVSNGLHLLVTVLWDLYRLFSLFAEIIHFTWKILYVS